MKPQPQQPLTLSQAQEMAMQNYPMIRQRALVKQTRDNTIENLNKGYLPPFCIGAPASY